MVIAMEQHINALVMKDGRGLVATFQIAQERQIVMIEGFVIQH